MFKKITSSFLVIFLLFHIFWFEGVFGVFNITHFDIRGSGDATFSYNPEYTFSFDIIATNTLGEDIKDVFIKIDFENNAGFLYNGIDQRTRIGSVNITNPVSLSAYNSSQGFSYEVTNEANSTISPGTTIQLSRASKNYNAFSINNTISTYQNNISAWFEARKVSDNSLVVGTIGSKIIYVNVKPHITDYYFETADGSQTTSQVQGSDSESINLVLKVKDYNGCSNIAGGTVTADLSQLGLGSSENLSYISCEGDGKIGVFKKTGITTNASLGDKTFNSSHFIAIDADGNMNDANDSRFGSEDKKTNLNLTVVAASAPQVSFLSPNNQKIGGPDKLSYTLSFSGNQIGEYKVALGSDGNCSVGTTLKDWTQYQTANTLINTDINSSSLQEGNNTIYACIKNSGENIGSINFNLIKDTTPPTASFPIISPVNVVLNDSSIKFSCSENGSYRVELGGNGTPESGTGILDWTQAIADTQYTTSISNEILSLGSNTIYTYCRDEATNISYKTGAVTKVPQTPSMVGTNIVLVDNDFDNQGLDGRDITTNWTLTSEITNATNFESYRIYLLPSNIEFNTSNQTYIQLIANKNTNSWIGTSSITKDSLNQNLVSGSSYKICIAIMGTSGQLGTESCSSPAILTADTVVHATITSAKFTSNTNLEITTDTTLDTNTGSHDFSKISYVYNGNTLNPTGVASINGTRINLTIPALNNLGATGSNIITQTGAIRSSVGGYNNYHTFANITDGQTPTITGFANNTSSIHNGFFSGSINVGFTFEENMRASGFTKITFDRTAGNAGAQRTFFITDPLKLVSGNHTQTLDLVSLGLVSGTTYDMKVVGQDLATNSVTSNAISVKFDNVGPTVPVLTDAQNTSSQTPTLSWSASTDDSGNGSGVKEYIIKIFDSANCSGGILQTLTSATTSKATNSLNNGTYSWNVYAVDNMGNIGTTSSCDSFLVDTTIPTIDNQKITDLNNSNSTNFTKSGNTIEITADLTNTDITKIKADLSALTGNASHTGVVCASPVNGVSCSYTSGKVTYSFKVGFAGVVQEKVRQIKLIVSNISQTKIIEELKSITVDNTAPTIGSISSPSNQTYGGNNLDIAWSGISDTNLENINVSYSLDGGDSYISVYTGSNISPYNWNISSLSTGNYKIKIIARDNSGNTSQTESETFSLDKSAPTISPGVFTNIASGQYIAGNKTYTLTWNTGSITDNEALPSNPITLEYSTNNGANWSLLANNLPNTGNYTWNIGDISGNQSKLRIKVLDNVGNESQYVESEVFTLDSQNPTFSITPGTPPNGAFINANGFEVIGSAGDNIKIDTILYSFKRNLDTTYFDGTSYTGAVTWNILQDNLDTLSYNLNETLNPTLVDGEKYDFTLKVVDKAGNEILSTPRQYIADLTNPNLTITNPDNSYFSGSINIAGTSSDTGAGISSVKISLKKGTQYWNGNSWVGSEQILATSTSDNYANWNYNFVAPGSDDDGQNYEITVYAYDKSYKVNNTSSGTINITLDKTGPVIEGDVFTFTPVGFYAGGENFEITWNPAKIISSGADFSHLKLEYNFGGNFTTIADDLENTGSYSFNLPEIDGNIKVVISAYDEIGNISNNIVSSDISIDSIPPTLVRVETMDLNANGQIDALKVTMSEAIKDSTIELGDFSLSGIGTPTSWETGNTSNDNVFILKFEDFGDTSSTPTLTYTRGNLTDMAGKFLEDTSKNSTDTANPRIFSAEIFADITGVFDKIEVVFSENMSSTSDISAFTLSNGLSISAVSISGNKAILSLNSGLIETDANGYTLGFTSNSSWKDSAGNQAGSLGTPIDLKDKAKPVLISAELLDMNNNFEADTLKLTFSEKLTGDISGFTTNSGTLGVGVLNNNQITFDIADISGTDPNIDISYSGNLEDRSQNILETFVDIGVVEKISPKLLTAKTLDQNANGKIDGILLELSEDIGENFSDFTLGVNGYSIEGYEKIASNQVLARLFQKSQINTTDTPDITILSNTLLKDISGNSVKSQSISSIDGVGPVIVGARYEPSTHKIYMNFSEDINEDDFIDSNFVLQNAGSYTIAGVDVNEKSITLSGENIDYSASTLSFVADTVRDNTGNKQLGTHFVSITAPIIINEIMISSDENNNYIELHNLSNDTISLSGWTIAGMTIPAGKSIDGNGYFLISKMAKENSILNVDPDVVDGNLDLTGNEIVLNNGSIDIDKASLTTGLGDEILPASLERKSPVGNGLGASSWYKSLTSVGFDSETPLGTPGSKNVFDILPPTLSSNLPGNMLLPVGNYDIQYTYSDNISINIESIDFTLEKWDGTSFINNSGYTSGSIDNNNANYSLSGLDYGRYKAIFSIADSAGNISTDVKEFYVDDFSFTISTGSLDLGVLEPNNLKLANSGVEITIKTLGAGFELFHSYDENNLGDFDIVENKGYGACEGGTCTQLENYKNKTIITQDGELQTSGELKTYTYRVKYGAKIDNLKPAGMYEIENKYSIEVKYE